MGHWHTYIHLASLCLSLSAVLTRLDGHRRLRPASRTIALCPLLCPIMISLPGANDPRPVESPEPAISSSPLLTPVCNVVTPVGMLGYGLHSDQTTAALVHKIRNGAPTAIILDSGSTDSGPEKLALGCMSVPRDAYTRDLRKLIELSWQFRVPLIFSSAGGDGSDEHVRELVGVVREVCEEGGNE